MTREEALQLLGLPDNAGPDAVQAKSGEVYNDYQLRLTNAPTPNLKKLYQKNLEELNEAMQVLLGGGGGAVLKELPSSAPIYDAGATTPPPARTAAPQRPAAPAKGKAAAGKGGPTWGLVTGLGIGLVVLLGAAAYFGLRHADDQKELGTLRPLTAQVEELNATIAAKDDYMRRYAQGKLKVRNMGQKSFTIVSVITTYKNKDDQFLKYESLWRQEVRGGSTVELSMVDGGKVVWDGSAIAFSLGISLPGYACPFIHGGVMNHEQVDGAINLNFDNF
jgi:hypothetical protein